MRLKKIRLAGFKSFVDPTNVPFPNPMTAIVGPNGCGKSNVIDAVRWVLGESSAKNLRGDAMTDVIFNGSTTRKPVSQCSVELVFDNSSQRIQGEFAAYNEISVKRLVTREAQSSYFLNNTKCRRKDVTDLFLGTGLGPRSYAIIEQGMISRLIESKPQELRIFIEEAAGISKYKERRRETENRIRHTRENLERLSDVRAELGQQLDKLQRQASAARRYKELKANERRYKGELATIRWLKLSDMISEIEGRMRQQETDIDAYIAKQRGDEKEITSLRQQQEELKQKLSDTQHQFYLVGNDITRLEESQHFAKRRKDQITQELNNLKEQDLRHEEELNEKEMQVETVEFQLEEIGPQSEVIEAQLLEIEEQILTLQDKWNEQQQAWRNRDQQFMGLKQKSQERHGKIQTLLQVQLRTEERIRELSESEESVEISHIEEEIETLKDELGFSFEQKLELQQAVQDAQAALDKAKLESSEARSQKQQVSEKLQINQAKLIGLQQIQKQEEQGSEALQSWLEDVAPTAKSIWEVLQVDSEWRRAVEIVMQMHASSWLVDDVNLAGLPAGGRLLFSSLLDKDKPENTLAQKCLNVAVPECLSRVEVVSSTQDALDKRAQLPAGFSLITQDGVWVGEDWIINGLESGKSSQLDRIASINQLQALIETLAEQETSAIAVLEQQEHQQEQAQDELNIQQQNLRAIELETSHCENKLSLLRAQNAKLVAQQEKKQQEKHRYQQQLEDEKLEMEELSMELEELEMQIAELDEQYGDIDAQRDAMEIQIQQARTQSEQLKSKQHELALQTQSLSHQLNALKDNHQRMLNERSLAQVQQSNLQQELADLAQPGEEQKEKLTLLLEQQETLRLEQQELAEQINQVESALSEAEKDQVGVQQQVERMRAEIQSLNLERERNQTRANGYVEQLQEMNQSLKTLIENLPTEYSEEIWRTELEKTTNALSRLGAVNLAAVEEYEVQSERKKHLDVQNDDLQAAMDTLETAIRKIDKETRSRFKDTFEKVNADVKMLFPKVFGGGAAYLELTGEDLLETGVTIMARPPGKKNSTIHLLSGGEKALTALSLVFAIFRLNPAPFCMLDEVDAPLDDANVGRFCRLVEEMSKTVQFIFITHNKITMEMAHQLTGVTMAEPGSSRIVAVDVEEAVAIASA